MEESAKPRFMLTKYRGSEHECWKRANAAEQLGLEYEIKESGDQWVVTTYGKGKSNGPSNN